MSEEEYLKSIGAHLVDELSSGGHRFVLESPVKEHGRLWLYLAKSNSWSETALRLVLKPGWPFLDANLDVYVNLDDPELWRMHNSTLDSLHLRTPSGDEFRLPWIRTRRSAGRVAEKVAQAAVKGLEKFEVYGSPLSALEELSGGRTTWGPSKNRMTEELVRKLSVAAKDEGELFARIEGSAPSPEGDG